jgi:hypothetical protein
MQRRFVFQVSGTGDDLFEGSDFEVRAETLTDACVEAQKRATRYACTMTLLGERIGFRSTSRFVSFVPLEKVPAWIQQNERVELASDKAVA